MISVTTTNLNPSAAGVGVGTAATSSQGGAAPDGSEFLLELQAALAVPADLPQDAPPDDKTAAVTSPEAEEAADAALQNLPTVLAMQAVPPAIFTVPTPVPLAAGMTGPAAAGTAESPMASSGQPVPVPLLQAVAAPDGQAPDLALPVGPSAAAPASQTVAASAEPLEAARPTGLAVATPAPALPEPLAGSAPAAPSPAVLAAVTASNPAPLATAAVAAALAPQVRQLAAASSAADPAAPTRLAEPERPAEGATALGELPAAQLVLAKAGELRADDAQAQAPLADAGNPALQAIAGPALAEGSAPDAAPLAAAPALAQATNALVANQPLLEPSYRSPVEPQHMRLDSGPVQVEVLKLVQQGGGQIVMQLTPPDQGTYRLDLRLDAQGQAHLVVEGASESVRTRLEQGEGGLREQLSQLGLNLQLDYRQPGSAFVSTDSSARPEAGTPEADAQADAAPGANRSRANAERGLVHLYA